MHNINMDGNFYGNEESFCPYCGNPKFSTYDTHCIYCKQSFNNNNKLDKKTSTILILVFSLIIILPSLLFGSIFLGIGLYEYHDEHSQAEGFIKTEAHLLEIDETDCTSMDGSRLCKAIYIYEVNGIKYQYLTDYYSNSFDDMKEIYYNPNNPNDAVIFSFWWGFIAIGGIFVVTGLLVIIILLVIWLKKRKDIKKQHQF